jgi:thioredoxin-like negative regulator of GroEL
MVNGGEHKAGRSLWTRAHGCRGGGRPGGGQGVLLPAWPWSFCGYAAACLAVLAVLGAWSLGVVGCTPPGARTGWADETPGSFFASLRPSHGEIARLKQNAHYYKLMGQPELGLKEMELARQQNPDNLQIINLLAQNYEELGKFEAARQLYREALTRHESNRVLANNLCFSYYLEGRWQEAETCFRKTLERDPQNVAARNNLGLLYCRLGRQDEARRLWQETEGVAAADAKMNQALAALGMPNRAVYARRPEPGPAVAKVTRAPTPETAVSHAPASVPAEANPPTQPVSSQEFVGPVAGKPPATTPGPLATRPRQEATAPKPAAGPGPAPQASSRPTQAPLTAAELACTAIEVRNGTWTKDLARQTRSRLNQEGFSVAFIGNHVDFGATKTIIYYHPGAERVARAVARTVFPGAGLEPSLKLKKGMDIKVLLGRDLLENPQFMARLVEDAPPVTPVSKPAPAPDQNLTAKTEAARPEARHQELPAVTPAKAEPARQPLPSPARAIAAHPLPAVALPPLTPAELVETAIEIRNGTWTKDLARQTRSRLSQEGFSVALIGNHLDFGAKKTIIYYRPGAERVAQAVARTVFPGAGLEASPNLKKGMDIKILLGADFIQPPQQAARLAGKAG